MPNSLHTNLKIVENENIVKRDNFINSHKNKSFISTSPGKIIILVIIFLIIIILIYLQAVINKRNFNNTVSYPQSYPSSYTSVTLNTWVRDIYSSDNKVIWNVLHPSDWVNLNTSGLGAGLLQAEYSKGDNPYNIIFSTIDFSNYSSFEKAPANIDDWVTSDLINIGTDQNSVKTINLDTKIAKVREVVGWKYFTNSAEYIGTKVYIWPLDVKKINRTIQIIPITQNLNTELLKTITEKYINGVVL